MVEEEAPDGDEGQSDITVLPFLKGADFSYNNFDGDNFPPKMNLMESVEWLRLKNTRLSWIPEEFGELKSLKKLNLSRNNLTSLHGELTCLKKLKFLYCHHNLINDSGVPVELFDINTLTVLDLSHNNLTVIPSNLENCTALNVLNLSHNKLRNLSQQIFMNLKELKHLDLSDNHLKTIPPQLGRLTNLKTLVLNNNPLEEYRMMQIGRLKTLENLQLANTQRNLDNIRTDLLELDNLIELNLSSNNLSKVPDDLVHLRSLKKLYLSENRIENLPEDFGTWWPNLTVFNVSGNNLTTIPPSLCKLCNLRRLYVNDNKLTFEGLPAALGLLHQLEVFMAARNNLESIPESISRCGNLKKLILTSNKLKLSNPIPLLFDLEVLELSNNPELEMPPKHSSDPARNPEYYNIDFSLDTQRRLAGDPDSIKLSSAQSAPSKDPTARKLRLRTRAKDIVEQEQANQAKVLKGMNYIVSEKENLTANLGDLSELDLKPKRWDEILEKPPIDYSDLFDDFTGQLQGLTIWDIENFYPALINPDNYGKFHDEDCYIVLSTEIDENQSLNWKIFYWIGANCTLDKKACSAIHAVGLRNHLNAQCRTIREEQGEESDEFLALFPDGIDYVSGHRTKCGFVDKEDIEHARRIYRLHEIASETRQLHLQTVDFSPDSLDSRFVFLLDIGLRIFIWSGFKSKNTVKQRARLIGEKLNKEERRSKAELIFCDQGSEPVEFLEELGLDKPYSKSDILISPDLSDKDITNFVPERPILYQVDLTACLELRQVDFGYGKLLAVYLNSSNVYVLDCHTDIFVWRGRKSSKIARLGAMRIAQDIHSMINRPNFAKITDFTQGNETQLFKTKFYDWDDVIAVDYTRTAESVSKTGPDLMKWMSKQIVKTDLSPLFMPRQLPLDEAEAIALMDSWNGELESIETFIVDRGKRFVKLRDEEFGHFYSGDSYIFLCRYSEPLDDKGSSDGRGSDETEHIQNGIVNGVTNGDLPPIDEGDFKVYFWQGRNASQMGWLNFTFSLQKKIEAIFGRKLDVIKMYQQREDEKFLAHFYQRFIIHQGKRSHSSQSIKPVQLYHLRSNNNPITLRCIEIEPKSSNLNSGSCFVVCINESTIPNGSSDDVSGVEDRLIIKSTIMVWIGSKAAQSEAIIAEEIARDKLSMRSRMHKVQVIHEGNEPEEFWEALGGRQDYETDATFMNYTRLFRCSNDKGYFCISEERIDFCQDDLSDDDIMILDNGSQVILWIGPKSSEVEIRLACKSAEVYVRDIMKKESARRQLMLTFKGKESRKFTKCFHAWGEHKVIKDPRGDEARFLKIQSNVHEQ